MAFLFRRKNNTEVTEPNKSYDRVLSQIVNFCLRLQNGWAQWMGRRTQHLTPKRMFLLLLTFTTLSGGYSIYLIGQSFSGNQPIAFSITPIKKLGYFQQTGDAAPKKGMIISKTEFQRIIRFRGYMDSLTRSPAGKATYDSILLYRPGLPDSILLIEKIYQSQTKK